MSCFSVLMSVYAKEKHIHLDKALFSISNQTVLPDEIILVHDGILTTELYDCINKWKKKLPVIDVPIKENIGLGWALKLGLQNCKHDLVIRCDTDDINVTNRFEMQLNHMMVNQGVAASSGYIEEFMSNPGDLKRIRTVPTDMNSVRKTIAFRNPLNHMAVILRKSKIESVGSYQHFQYMEDYYLWLRLYDANYIIDNLPVVLVHARVGNDMLRRRKGVDYIKSEINRFRLISNMKFTGMYKLFFYSLLRIFIRILPAGLLSLLYKLSRKNY